MSDYKDPIEKIRSTGSGETPGSSPVSKWFKDDLSRRAASRRIGKGLAWTAGLGMLGLTGYKLFQSDDKEVSSDSLDLQKREGWNVGSTDRQLNFDPTFTQASASVSGSDWRTYLDPSKLIAAYQPLDKTWQPYFVPTLIQSLAQSTLRDQVKPVKTPIMDETYGQGQALKELLSQSANAKQGLILADLDGIQAVAFGAAMSDYATIVPTFDNWPHPLGVVNAHETLGSMVYYAKEIESHKAQLKPDAPAVLLLDSGRLNDYKDAENQFDNRYTAKIPSAAELKQRGITSILYVVKDDRTKQETDDLNDDFVDFQKQGINVRFLKLSDFKKPTGTVPGAPAGMVSQPGTAVVNHYYYGGSPYYHWWFYDHYYYRPYPYAYTTWGGTRYNYSRPVTPAPFRAPSYAPVSRPTIFSGTRVGGASGVGRGRPSGFGRTSVRMSSSGQVTGVRSGRSGSYGRGGGLFGG